MQRTSTLYPYVGDRRSEHLGPDGRGHTVTRYASDSSGTKTYRFNAAGFRGEELDPAANFRLFVCGSSYGIGTGLDWEETWGYQLKCRLAEHHGIEPRRVNLLNFSQSLASASYVTRTLLAQCRRVVPHLVVAHYSFCARNEVYLDGRVAGVAPRPYPWYRRLKALRPGWHARLARYFPDLTSLAEARRRLRTLHGYSELYSPELGIATTLTQILLLQSYCRSQGIECLVSWAEHRLLHEPRYRDNPALAPLIELIDTERFCPFSIADKSVQTDFAADGVHPGPQSSSRYAERLLQRYAALTMQDAGHDTASQRRA